MYEEGARTRGGDIIMFEIYVCVRMEMYGQHACTLYIIDAVCVNKICTHTQARPHSHTRAHIKESPLGVLTNI